MLYSQMAMRIHELIVAQIGRLEQSNENLQEFLDRKEEMSVSAEIVSLNSQMHAIEEVSF